MVLFAYEVKWQQKVSGLAPPAKQAKGRHVASLSLLSARCFTSAQEQIW